MIKAPFRLRSRRRWLAAGYCLAPSACAQMISIAPSTIEVSQPSEAARRVQILMATTVTGYSRTLADKSVRPRAAGRRLPARRHHFHNRGPQGPRGLPGHPRQDPGGLLFARGAELFPAIHCSSFELGRIGMKRVARMLISGLAVSSLLAGSLRA